MPAIEQSVTACIGVWGRRRIIPNNNCHVDLLAALDDAAQRLLLGFAFARIEPDARHQEQCSGYADGGLRQNPRCAARQ